MLAAAALRTAPLVTTEADACDVGLCATSISIAWQSSSNTESHIPLNM
jgi:hypothetical protein